MEQSPRFALPFLVPGQAQKEWFHNEALQLIDVLVAPAIETIPSPTPPISPLAGQCFVVGGGATGVWAGHDNEVAAFGAGGWRFITPTEGLSLFIKTTGELLGRRGGIWETGITRLREVRVNGQTVIRDRQAAIASPDGGSSIDAESRSAIMSILAAMRAHGLIDA